MPKVTLTQQIQECGVQWTRTKEVDLSTVPMRGDYIDDLQVTRVMFSTNGRIVLTLDEEWDNFWTGADSQDAAKESMQRDRSNGWKVKCD